MTTSLDQTPAPEGEPLISIRDLRVHFKSGGKLFKASSVVKAVDGVSLDIYSGETVGLVGESGCGKSTLGRAILRLADITSGNVVFGGQDLAHLSTSAMRAQRRNLQVIFQDPYASLNPRMTVGQIIGEPIRTFERRAVDEKRPLWLRLLGVAIGVVLGFVIGRKVAGYFVPFQNLTSTGILRLAFGALSGTLAGAGAGSLVYYLFVRRTFRFMMAMAFAALGVVLTGTGVILLERGGPKLETDFYVFLWLLIGAFAVRGWITAARIRPDLGTVGQRMEKRVQELMETVGLNRRFIKRFPHEFSGGQRQRIGIARALSVNPKFVVADEPISALDVSIQAQIINLLEKLRREKNLTYLFISHDLRAVERISDRVAVMYLGKIVELADAASIYAEPLMPYTRALISAVPVPDPKIEAQRRRVVLQGDVPSPINPPRGCRFHTRCPYAIEACRDVEPRLVEIKPKHFAACIRISPEQPNIDRVAPGAAPGLAGTVSL